MVNTGLPFHLILEQPNARLQGLNNAAGVLSQFKQEPLEKGKERGSKGHIRQKEPHNQSETTAVFLKLLLSLQWGLPGPHWQRLAHVTVPEGALSPPDHRLSPTAM